MAVGYRSFTYLVVVVLVLGLATAEIHRAKSVQQMKPRRSGTSQQPTRKPVEATEQPSGPSPFNTSCTHGTEKVVSGHDRQTWLYSIVSAILVGLSGIFPLLVIPIDATEMLKNGASGGLMLLLSFAIGGLLGDVFLHLLPEAFAHAKNMNDRMDIGLWVLAGLFTFLIIEKVFPDSNEDDDDQEVVEEFEGRSEGESVRTGGNRLKEIESRVKCVESKVNKHSQSNGTSKTSSHINGFTSTSPPNTTSSARKGTQNQSAVQRRRGIHDQRTSQVSIKPSNGHASYVNGAGVSAASSSNCVGVSSTATGRHIDLCTSARYNRGGKDAPPGSHSEASLCPADQRRRNSQSVHVKTIGWLNLLANMIDNFTHGLAVAGSYSVSTKTGLLTTAAILLHEVPHEIGDFAILLRSGFDRWKAAKAQMLTATGGLLGVVVALCAESTQEAGERTAWILPFTSGSFIYIALVSVLPDILKDNNFLNTVKQMFMLVLGVAVMAAVTCLE